MPGHFVPLGVKAQVPLLYHDDHSIEDICHMLGIKKSLVYKILSFHSKYGTITDPYKYSRLFGRRRILSSADVGFISAVVQHHSTIYLDEIQHEIWAKRHKFVSLSTLLRTLQRLRITRKIVSAPAIERNEEIRAIYMNRIAADAPDPNMLVFIDEAAKDRRTSSRQHGRSIRGVRCCVQRYFVRGTRYSIIPAITLDGIIAYDIIEGPVDSQRFLKFLEEHVMPLTNPYPGPRSVIVMDNCRIHKSEAVRALIEDMHSCKLIFLPPYSPDYNPIEQAFSAIKAYFRRHSNDFSMTTIARACQNITPDKAEGYFRASGYIV